MDPNANLDEQLQLALDLLYYAEREPDPQRLAELVIALHDWIRVGGFLPTAWTHDRVTHAKPND